MKTLTLAATATAIIAGLAITGARASDDDGARIKNTPPRAEWMSLADLAQRLEAQGYVVHEIETDDGLYEVEMTDPQGLHVEAYLHPVTGEPVRRRGYDD
jgi:hypothetical protein